MGATAGTGRGLSKPCPKSTEWLHRAGARAVGRAGQAGSTAALSRHARARTEEGPCAASEEGGQCRRSPARTRQRHSPSRGAHSLGRGHRRLPGREQGRVWQCVERQLGGSWAGGRRPFPSWGRQRCHSDRGALRPRCCCRCPARDKGTPTVTTGQPGTRQEPSRAGAVSGAFYRSSPGPQHQARSRDGRNGCVSFQGIPAGTQHLPTIPAGRLPLLHLQGVNCARPPSPQ